MQITVETWPAEDRIRYQYEVADDAGVVFATESGVLGGTEDEARAEALSRAQAFVLPVPDTTVVVYVESEDGWTVSDGG